MDFITTNLPLILCLIVGFGLMMVEAFMPGFGVAGVLGIVLEIGAIYLAWTNHGLVFGLILTLVIIAVIALTVFLSYRSFLNGRLSKSKLVLPDTEKAAAPRADTLRVWVGKKGKVATPLRPAGEIEINGKRLSASSAGEFLSPGTPVEVTGTQGDHLIVRSLA